MLSDNHIKHFIEKSKKFLDRYISYTNNSLGIPSVIKIKKFKTSILDRVGDSPDVSFCVTQSVERHYASLKIANILETEMCLPPKESFQIAEYIVQKKYNQYIDVVMST